MTGGTPNNDMIDDTARWIWIQDLRIAHKCGCCAVPQSVADPNDHYAMGRFTLSVNLRFLRFGEITVQFTACALETV